MSEKKIFATDHFALCGEVKVNEKSYKTETYDSGWRKDIFRFGVQTGENNVVYVQLEGGMHTKKDNIVYTKNNDKQQMQVAWEDRLNPKIVEVVDKYSKIKVGIEKDINDKTYTKEFIAPYDAVQYIHENLKSDTRLLVKGEIQYSYYNEKIYKNLMVTEMYLSNNPDGFARFTQSIVLENGSVEKADGVVYLDVLIPRYVNKIKDNGTYIEIKETVGFQQRFEVPAKTEQEKKIAKALVDKFFKVKSGNLRKMTIEGNIISGTEKVEITLNDLDKESRELIEMGILNADDVLGKMAVKGGNIEKYVFTKPYFKKNTEGDSDIDFGIVDLEEDEFKTVQHALSLKTEGGNESKSEEVNMMDDDWMNELLK